jgi:hypothetical protein
MAMLVARMRFALGALLLLTIFSMDPPASAQQRNPDNSVNPTASSVKEDALLGELNAAHLVSLTMGRRSGQRDRYCGMERRLLYPPQ